MVLNEAPASRPTLFLDDWPLRPKESAAMRHQSGLDETIKWRFQTILAAEPLGIPLLAFVEAYEQGFARRLDIEQLGFVDFPAMVSSLADVFTVQEPDETTAAIFANHPDEIVLHDARLGHTFEPSPSPSEQGDRQADLDQSTLVARALLNRDEPLPEDVVLPGERYSDAMLISDTNLEGTRGIHTSVMVSAASPSYLFVHVKSPDLDRIAAMTPELESYFKQVQLPAEAFDVPNEFICAGFPCLVYSNKRKSFDRCAIISRHTRRGKVLIESVDFGDIRTVKRTYLRLMPKKYLDIPKQAFCVSLLGIKPPAPASKWTVEAGKRLRCFSNIDYYLECLLVESKKKPDQTVELEQQHLSEAKSLASADSLKKKPKKFKKKHVQFEALLCDRNDDEMDLHISEILTLETYAAFDPERLAEYNVLMSQFKKALAAKPRTLSQQ